MSSRNNIDTRSLQPGMIVVRMLKIKVVEMPSHYQLSDFPDNRQRFRHYARPVTAGRLPARNMPVSGNTGSAVRDEYAEAAFGAAAIWMTKFVGR